MWRATLESQDVWMAGVGGGRLHWSRCGVCKLECERDFCLLVGHFNSLQFRMTSTRSGSPGSLPHLSEISPLLQTDVEEL